MTLQTEQLASGIANLTDADDTDPSEVRIVPIPEGERTVGQSGTETYWDREALREAVDSGALNGATIVKGQGGTNPHFPMNEQVPPDHILGKVDEWSYEDGVGPVGYAQLADEEIAKRVDMGLLEVSADMSRVLGDYDEALGAYPVESIVAMPRVTILEEGAARNASIEPATAEALGVHADGLGPSTETDDSGGGGGASTEQLSAVHTPSYDGTSEQDEWERPVLDDFPTDDLSEVDDYFLVSETSFPPEAFGDLHLPVVNPESRTLSLRALQVAKSRAPQTEGVASDDLRQAESIINRLAAEEFDRDWSDGGEEQNAPEDTVAGGDDAAADVSASDEPAEPGRDADTDADSASGSDSDMTDEKIQELQEQLAEARQKNDTLREEKESLESETDELESELSEKEETVEELEEEKESLEAENEDLEAERQSFGRALGARLAGEDSPFTPDEYAEQFDVDTLADKVVIAEGLADEDERQSDDYDPKALVEEQLAQSPAHRGQEPEDDEGGDNVTEEQLAAANEWAYEVISGSDLARVSEDEQLSPRELAAEKTGVDPAECESRSEFVRKVNAENTDGAAVGGDD